MDTPTLSRSPSVRLPWSHSPQVGQISPNKNMNFPRTTAAFTLSPVPCGFRHLVLTHPETEPTMRFTRRLPAARPSGQPPAVQIAPGIHHCMGGVKINTEAEVIDVDGAVIPNLYAAGEVTGGVHGGNRLGGNAVADFVVFGRIAGENASE